MLLGHINADYNHVLIFNHQGPVLISSTVSTAIYILLFCCGFLFFSLLYTCCFIAIIATLQMWYFCISNIYFKLGKLPQASILTRTNLVSGQFQLRTAFSRLEGVGLVTRASTVIHSHRISRFILGSLCSTHQRNLKTRLFLNRFLSRDHFLLFLYNDNMFLITKVSIVGGFFTV